MELLKKASCRLLLLTKYGRFLIMIDAEYFHLFAEFPVGSEHAVLILFPLVVIHGAFHLIIELALIRLFVKHTFHPIYKVLPVDLKEPMDWE